MHVLVMLPTVALACARAPASDPAPPASASSLSPPSLSVSPPSPSSTGPCGPLACTPYDSFSAAFEAALAAADLPRIVAVGEAHRPKGATVPSSAQRFTDEILPSLRGRASDLLVELLAPQKGCERTTADVKQKQSVVTSKQAPTDQDEYRTMGDRARALGVVPDLLWLTCQDLAEVSDAGEAAIDVSLRTIQRLTRAKVQKLVDRDLASPTDKNKFVVTYGGAIHNDPEPTPERAAWSFGPALDAYVGGKYVAVDVFVPEFIRDDASWKSQDWYVHYDKTKLGGKTTLFRTGARSFVIVLAASEPK
jgi:hypothetical protein